LGRRHQAAGGAGAFARVKIVGLKRSVIDALGLDGPAANIYATAPNLLPHDLAQPGFLGWGEGGGHQAAAP
jgi:hypothetical protein